MAQTAHDLVEDDAERSLSNASLGIGNAVDIMQWQPIVGGQLARPTARPLHRVIFGIGFSCNGSELVVACTHNIQAVVSGRCREVSPPNA